MLLEDDSMFVRMAAIKSISHFAKQCPAIRLQSMRFLIDMLNDEIDEVRIGALAGIASFNHVMKLNESEVDTVLFTLKEDNLKLRQGIYKFFGEIVIEEPNLFLKLVERVIANLSKFSNDQHCIFRLMQNLGKNHCEMVVAIYCRIIDIDKRYLVQEPLWSLTDYVAKIILIHAAAVSVSPGQKVIDTLDMPPFYLEKHLNYFKDKYSNYFVEEAQDLMSSHLVKNSSKLSETRQRIAS